MLELVIKGLACWRLTHMLIWERGPYNVFIKLREFTGITHNEDGVPESWSDGNVLACHYCTSIWVAAILLASPDWIRKVLAVSALSIMVEEKWPEQK